MDVSIILSLIFTHWVADFAFQSDSMAIKKSSSNIWLGFHVMTYIIAFLWVWNVQFLVANALIHFGVDYVTSRATSYLWGKEDRHNFFVMIGFDQFIHISTLILTYSWFVT